MTLCVISFLVILQLIRIIKLVSCYKGYAQRMQQLLLPELLLLL